MTIPHSRRRRWIAGALATAAAVPLLATPAAQAAGTTSAVCTPQFTLTIAPGFTLAASSGSLTSNGETGSLTCVGTVDGARVTGPGTVGLDETYARSDCASHVGVGTARITLPTTAGPKHIVGAATSRRTAPCPQRGGPVPRCALQRARRGDSHARRLRAQPDDRGARHGDRDLHRLIGPPAPALAGAPRRASPGSGGR